MNYRNTSEYPDDWARAVVDWIANRFELGEFGIHIRNTSRSGHGRAWWGQRRTTCSISRRSWRRDWTYSTISWAKEYKVESALEAFVFLVAHELHHLSREARRWRDELQDTKAHWRQSFEQRTDRRAWETVLAYRDEARAFLKLYKSRLRRKRLVEQRACAAKSEKRTPGFRLAHAEKMQAVWERKARLAANRAKKWRTRANRIRARVTT